MKYLRIFIVFTLILFSAHKSYSYQKGFERDTTERLVKVEAEIRAVNQRIDDLNQSLSRRIDDVMNLLYVVIAGMFGLIGFVIWDRRTALAPAIRINKELEEREERIEKALREYAKKEPGLAEVLKNLGLM